VNWHRHPAFLLIFIAITPVAHCQTKSASTVVETPISERVIAQIQILGLEKIPESAVLEMIEAKEWKQYSPAAMSRDLTRLLGSGLFLSASIKAVPLSSEAIRVDINLKERKSKLPDPEPAPVTAPAPLSRPIIKTTPEPTAREKAARALGAVEDDEIPASPWVIGEIYFSGRRNVKQSTIRSQTSARKGGLYERAELQRDIQSILSLGNFERVVADITVLKDRKVPAHFESVSPSPHPIKLTFIVEEKPIIKKILFVGRDRVSKGRLLDSLDSQRRDPFDRVKMRTDTEKITETYKKKGFHRITVESAVEIDTTTHKAIITFTLEEGPKARIAGVIFAGVTAFKQKKLAKKMKNRRKKIFDESKLEEDLKKVTSFYKNRGYLDFKIISSSIAYHNEGKKISIYVTVEEGNPYRFGETTFSGHKIYSSTTLIKALEYRKTKLYNEEKFNLTVAAIQELYAEKGRLRAQVYDKKNFNAVNGLMDIHFEISEGPTVYVDHVDVEGYKSTKGYVFTRELLIKPKMPFQISKIKKSQQRIFNLGFIDDIQLDVQSPYDPEKVDLTFEIFEGKPGMLTAGAGFSSLDGLIGTIALQHLNLFGRAYKTSLQWQFGSRVNDFSISWTTPWIYARPISLGFDVFNTRRISPFNSSSSAFITKRTGGSIRVGPRFQDDKYQLQLRYSFQKIATSNIEQQFAGALSAGTSIQSSIGVDFARDTRDNIWDPASGSRNSIGVTLSGGPVMGDINYIKPNITSSYNHTLFHVNEWPMVLTVANRAGYVTQFGETREVPVFERFFIGGQDTLRGYSATGEAGFRDGGKVYDVFNIELGFPLARERRRTIVKFVTFFDIGGSWDRVGTVSARIGPGQEDIKMDVGFGIRFTTPAFPIRLDWGYGFQHRPGESKYQINFGIGNLF